MPRDRPDAAEPAARENEPWPIVPVRVPPHWKRWLEQAAEARGLSVAALVRQCIRELMIATRADRAAHVDDGEAA